jgi:hypothetical protein
MHDTDRAAAALAEIRERYEYLGPLYQNPHFMLDAVVQDVPRLVAAVEAALNAADRWKQFAALGDAQDECADELRATITATLTGEGSGNG